MPATDTALNAKVRALVDQQLAEGRQLGTQVCAYRNGERIVDIWAGQMGSHDPRPVQPDSLFSSFSTTKGPAATALHILADRGLIDYDAPVAKYWPEFAANGKAKITVAQAMSHQAGLHAAPNPLTIDFVTDWQGALDWIANATPAYEPGTSTGYHAFTYAWIVGGIVQGASGRHLRDVIQEEIARPLGVDGEMYVGIPDGIEDRLTSIKAAPRPAGAEAASAPRISPDHDMLKAMPVRSELNFNDMRVRKACLPSANGHFSARALARMYAALANGGEIDGVRLVSVERIPSMYRLCTDLPDRVIGRPIRKGIGFFLGGSVDGVHGAQGPRESSFGHAGAGGSIAFADPEVGLSVAVTLNQMQPQSMQGEGVTLEICELIRDQLGLNEG